MALSAVHRRLTELFRLHDRLRIADPDAWLDGANDAAFMTLWREHSEIVRAMEQRLLTVAGTAVMLQQRTFPA